MRVLRGDSKYRESEVEYQRRRYHTDDAYRLRKKARAKAYKALQRGTLTRLPCEVCQSDNVEIHHEDYARPLVVRWLCRRHHLDGHHFTEPDDPIAIVLKRLDARRGLLT